jgi:hypothetical protein
MKIFTLVILLMLCSIASAQIRAVPLSKGNIFLRFNILNLADVSEPNISFGAERRISPHVSLAMDAAYIIMSQRFHEKGNSSGFIVRPAVRYFPDNSKVFLEAELHYKQHTHRIYDWVGRDMVGGVATYQEYKQFKLRKQVMGPHLKFGGLVPVTHRLWLEFYVGVGLHFRRYTVPEEKDFVYTFDQLFEQVSTGQTEKLVAIPMGWRILYRLR